MLQRLYFEPVSGYATARQQHLQVRPHDALHSQPGRDPMQLIEIQPRAAPRLSKGFHRDIQPNLIPEPEAVGNRARDARDPHDLALELVLLDAHIEHGARDVDHPDWRVPQRRHASASGNGEPHLAGELRPDVVEAEGCQ